jgi:L-fuculose-phosphate aldolase
MLMLARSLGQVNYFSEPETKALIDLKGQWGYKDPRAEMKNCELCANDVFRESWKETGVGHRAFTPPKFLAAAGGNGAATAQAHAGTTPEQEALIQAITERVLAVLNKK